MAKKQAGKKSVSHRLTNIILEPYNPKYDGAETGDFQTYVKKRKKTKRKAR